MSHKFDVVYLVGGKGKRLASISGDVAKPLIKINNKELIEHVIAQNFTDAARYLILAAGFKFEQFEAYRKSSKFKNKLRLVRENSILGTGGAIVNVLRLFDLTEDFIICNGDTLINLDFRKLYRLHVDRGEMLTICGHKNIGGKDTGTLSVDPEGYIRAFKEKSDNPLEFVNTGIYAMNGKKFLNFINRKRLNKQFSFEKEILTKIPTMIPRVMFFESEYEFLDVGTPERFMRAKKVFKEDNGNE